MQYALTLIAIAAIALAVLRPLPRHATVVVDGDSLRVRGADWRLTGYDAPEWNQPGGRAAAGHLRRIVQRERCLVLIRGRDAYGRALATVITPRGPLSWRMAAAGHAHGEGLVGTTLTVVARIRGVGLWGLAGHHLRPRLWRDGWR